MPAYKPLTEEQVKSIAAKYYEDVKGRSQYQKEPGMLLVGGQPGAGKSYAARLAGQELDNAGTNTNRYQ